MLRDNIYEKVSVAFANCGELEQDAIGVEVFTYALADADLVQRLLEEKSQDPPTLPAGTRPPEGLHSHSAHAVKCSQCH